MTRIIHLVSHYWDFWTQHVDRLERLLEKRRMKLIDTTVTSQTDSISFEVDLHHPPKKVWRALTEPALLTEWLLPVIGLKLEAGAEFTLKKEPQPGWDGTVNCRLLEIEEEKKISYTWVVGDFIDTVVTFRLTPSASGTLLSIVQSGFRPDQKQNFGGARYGWRLMGGRLLDLLERLP
jgi:uncharacterized protein YndB with AHSA1/START domain